MARKIDRVAVLDALAQALILTDVTDEDTVSDLRAAVARVGDLKPAGHAKEILSSLAEAVRVLGSGDGSGTAAGLQELERLFVELERSLKESPARPEHPSRRTRSVAKTAGAGSAAASAQSPAMPLAADAELLRDFVARANEHLDAADQHLLVLEKDPGDTESLNAVFRTFHTIKGMAGFLALNDIERGAHETETALDGPRKGTAPLDGAAFDAAFVAVDRLRSLVAMVGVPVSVGSAARPPTGSAKAAPARGARPQVANSVRVDEERLDRLLDMIGELVIAESMFSETSRREIGGALSPQLAGLDKITRELQEMATSLRMVPLRSTFARMSRLTRDLSHKAGKSVEFVSVGDDTELDKLVVDRIYDPLVHILRNAVDHGIETAEERRALGKPETGQIRLSAFHGGGRIHIQVSDDGRGFDADAILAAARKRSLIGDEERPTDAEVVDLAFAPGLSTARVVTDVSGRGVGMDVVRRTVESLRGDVEITTEKGQGTRLWIRLPLTLAIIDGMVVRVGTERFIIPTLSIERSVRPGPKQVSNVLGRGRVMSIDDRLVPLVRLADVFEIDDAQRDAREGIVVVVSENADRVGLVACEILGQQQIVIKPLGEGVGGTRGIAGGAIMPDGHVGLILDVADLVRLARAREAGVARAG